MAWLGLVSLFFFALCYMFIISFRSCAIAHTISVVKWRRPAWAMQRNGGPQLAHVLNRAFVRVSCTDCWQLDVQCEQRWELARDYVTWDELVGRCNTLSKWWPELWEQWPQRHCTRQWQLPHTHTHMHVYLLQQLANRILIPVLSALWMRRKWAHSCMEPVSWVVRTSKWRCQ